MHLLFWRLKHRTTRDTNPAQRTATLEVAATTRVRDAMMSASVVGKALRASQNVTLRVSRIAVRTLSDKSSTPANLPGLSPEQIRKIGDTDTSLRTRHIQIEGDMSADERDVARVRLTQLL